VGGVQRPAASFAYAAHDRETAPPDRPPGPWHLTTAPSTASAIAAFARGLGGPASRTWPSDRRWTSTCRTPRARTG